MAGYQDSTHSSTSGGRGVSSGSESSTATPSASVNTVAEMAQEASRTARRDAGDRDYAVDLTTLTSEINDHLRDHQSRTSEECQAVMGSVEANLEMLTDRHFSVEADPARVSEMLLFHVMFSG